VVLVVSAFLLLAFLGARMLEGPDEPRDAETAREAAEGLWTLVPEINGDPFLERPPLFYWMVAGSFRALGEPTDAAAKLVPALLGLLTVASTWLLGESLLGKGRGWLPSLLLLGAPYFFLKFRVCVTDTGLAAFTTLSLALFFTAYRKDSWTQAAAAGAAAGLAFLCKGLLGFGIPAVVAGTWLMWKSDLKAILRLRLWVAVLVGVAMVLPWIWALYRVRGTEGLAMFFVHHHVGRFGEDADHAAPFWFYIRILWVALPLGPLVLAGMLRGGVVNAPGRDALRAGVGWVLSLLVVLSAVGGKRLVYLLPLFPGLAIAAAAAVEMGAAGTLSHAGDRIVRFMVRAVEVLTLQFPWARTRDLRTRAAAGALGLAVLALAYDAAVAPRWNSEHSGRALAIRAAELSRGRPLVLFRVGEGKIGQFTFAMRTRLPVVWTEPDLLRRLGAGPAVLLAERRHFDGAVKDGSLSAGTAARLRLLEEGLSDGGRVFVLLAWDGPAEATIPGEPRERR
jgi:4-amino-4-deoxy-L-arabinose transferase-like glycosyltransferase